MGTNQEDLARVLQRLGEEYRTDIRHDSRIFCVVKLNVAYWVVNSEACTKPNAEIRIPVRTDGSGKNIPTTPDSFAGYVQVRDSGLLIPQWLADESGVGVRAYKPRTLMYRNIGGNRENVSDTYYNPYEVEFYQPPLEEIDLTNAPVN